jgi:hypothetical protein
MKLMYSNAASMAMMKALMKKLRAIFFLSDMDRISMGLIYHTCMAVCNLNEYHLQSERAALLTSAKVMQLRGLFAP